MVETSREGGEGGGELHGVEEGVGCGGLLVRHGESYCLTLHSSLSYCVGLSLLVL